MSNATLSTNDSRHSNILLWLVAIGFFMQNLDATVVNTALPTLAKAFNKSTIHMQWVLVTYMLTNAILIPASGWLADRFGTRRIYAAAIVLFTLGSFICSMANNLETMLCARVIQGMGAAFLIPVGRLAVLRSYPREKFLKAMSFVLVPGMVGQLIGPSLGGFIVEYLRWEGIFLINIPIGIIGFVVTSIAMPDQRATQISKFDIAGYSFLAVAMVSLSLFLDGVGVLDLRKSLVFLLFIVGLFNVSAYILHARRTPQPLFSNLLYRITSFRIGIIGNVFARIGSGGMPFLLPLFLQIVLGYSPAQAGMMMLPVAVAAISIKRMVPSLVERLGYRLALIGNTILLGLIIAGFSWLTPQMPFWLAIFYMFLFGAINSLQFSIMNSVALKDLDNQTASSGNTMLSMTQMLSMSLGVTIASTVLHFFSEPTNSGVPVHAYHMTFIVIGFSSCIAALVFARLPKNKVNTP